MTTQAQPIDRGPDWRPGRLGRLRAMVRRLARLALGPRGERRLHAAYHRVLRMLGRFGPPEDPATIAVLGAIASRSETMIDVGANVGRYAWFLQRHGASGSSLVALEPHPGAAWLLRRNLRGMARTTVLEVAASDRDEEASLIVPVGAFGSTTSGLAWVRPGAATDVTGAITVPMRRLDGLVADGRITIRGPVLLKIDVEGAEGAVLRGAATLLRDARPVIYFECQASSLARQGETPASVWRLLEDSGYTMFVNRAGRFARSMAVDDEIVNYLAVPDVGGRASDGPFDASTLASLVEEWADRSGGA